MAHSNTASGDPAIDCLSLVRYLGPPDPDPLTPVTCIGAEVDAPLP
jgi:hypothetical protein